MSRATRLANHIERTATGPMWHGPALLEVLKGVACDQALARPLPDAHTIWELVLHITAWCDIAAQRIKGNATGDPTPEQDWPPVPASLPASGAAASGISPAAEWRLAIEQLVDNGDDPRPQLLDHPRRERLRDEAAQAPVVVTVALEHVAVDERHRVR